ncbi:MAG: ESX secretion-associated protein EspG [Haloechinothrix sp.]
MEFSVEAAAIEVLADHLSLRRSWQPFVPQHVGKTTDERRVYVEQVWSGLRADGLLDGERLNDDVESALRVWSAPEVLVVVRADQDFDPPRVLYRAAANRHLGVFSQQDGERIRFELMQPDRLIEYVTGMMPQLGPVPVRRHSEIVRGAQRASSGDGELPTVAEQARAEAHRDSEGLRAFAQWPVVLFGGYELHLREQGRMRHVGTMQFFDTEGGRYVVTDEPVSGGKRRLEFIPSDGSDIRRWLHEEVSFWRRDQG